MKNRIQVSALFVLGAVASLTESRAEAACDTTGTDQAYGDFWIERNSSGDCLIYQRRYGCVASGGYRSEGSPILVDTLSGDPATACEDTDGYDEAIASATANWTAGSAYNCDTVFTDEDGDGFGACIDQDETDPRVWVKVNAAERICDGVDNDNDGTVDDGLTGCAEDHDHKRLGARANYQGMDRSAANLVDGNLLLTQTDAVVQGPYGPLVLSRTYDSRRGTADAAIGLGWSHSFATYLSQMPAGDNRWRVQIGPEMQYFRCEPAQAPLQSDMLCAIDDHRLRGNLRRISGKFYFYPGDGSRIRFGEQIVSGRRLWDLHEDGAGFEIASATMDDSGRVETVETANASIYLHFEYGTYGLDKVRINSTSAKQILEYTVDANNLLTTVQFASAVGTISEDILYSFTYDENENLTEIQQKLDATTTLTTARFDYDTGDRVTRIEDRSTDLAIAYPTASETTVTYEVAATGNPSTDFTHNGLWVTAASSDLRIGRLPGASVTYDLHGRITCHETDDSRMFKRTYDDGALTKIDEYGKSGSCSSGGTILHETWLSSLYNADRQSWRQDWVRTKSVFNPASSCSGATLPSGCRETSYDYVSATDDRIQWITRSGYTKNVSETVSQQIRKQRVFYFGLDTGVCTSASSYAGLPCRIETQDSGGSVFARTDYTYLSSGASAGLLETVRRHDKSGDSAPLATTYASYNDFGSPGQITDERGMVTDFVFNGWGAVTGITENDAIIDAAGVAQDLTTSYTYTNLRTISTITLPKGNKRVYEYLTGTNDYGRVKAFALADASSNLTEILRYEHDKMGRRTERKIIDSIDGSTPCADEDCTTLDGREQWEYDAVGRIKKAYLHAADTSDPADASMTYAYVNGKLDEITDYLGNATSYEYDDQGRTAKINRDAAGIDAETSFTYDGQGRLLTTTSPTGVVTRTERNDFGEVVLEKAPTIGDIHREYDVAGRLTKRRESQYDSALGNQDHCYSYDWLGRETGYDLLCDSSNNVTLHYDGDSLPADACDSGTVHAGRLTMHTNSTYKRVLCYHPNGRIYSSFQVMGTPTWSNSAARGFTRFYDENGNLTKEYLEDRPDNHDHAREIEYVYDSTHEDRIRYIRHKLTSAGTWTLVTSDTTDPTYFAFGGFKTVKLANNIVETNEYDKARRLTRRKTDKASPAVTYTDLNLTYDIAGRITHYDDHLGKRHLEYYTAYDDLNRLRCVGRSSISGCAGAQPWSDDFLESFDYDESGNRTQRTYGAYANEDDEYTYVTGTDIIDKVKVAGTNKEMSNSDEGEITAVNTPNNIAYTWSKQGRLSTANNNFLGNTTYRHTHFHDLFEKISVCNSRKTWYFNDPTGAGGSSHRIRVLDYFTSCASNYPRLLRTFIYLEGRPIAVVHSTRTSGTDNQTEGDTFWIHSDQLGSPILVTDSSGTERWRWENDPFGREKPVEFTVFEQDVNPDDDPSTGGDAAKYNTCCCAPSCGAGCNLCETSCSAGACTGGTSQDVIWSKTYSVSGANNIRLHFSEFDVASGSSRTGKDYVEFKKADDTVIAQLTGDLGAHWTPWAGEGESSIKLELVSDYAQDDTRGFVVDKVEYTTNTNGRFVLDLRMPGQVWDADAYASYNFRRWYRSEDARYLSPDPIGLEGGEPGYHAYANSDPLDRIDFMGLEHLKLLEPDRREGAQVIVDDLKRTDCNLMNACFAETRIKVQVRCIAGEVDRLCRLWRNGIRSLIERIVKKSISSSTMIRLREASQLAGPVMLAT